MRKHEKRPGWGSWNCHTHFSSYMPHVSINLPTQCHSAPKDLQELAALRLDKPRTRCDPSRAATLKAPIMISKELPADRKYCNPAVSFFDETWWQHRHTHTYNNVQKELLKFTLPGSQCLVVWLIESFAVGKTSMWLINDAYTANRIEKQHPHN